MQRLYIDKIEKFETFLVVKNVPITKHEVDKIIIITQTWLNIV